MSKVNVEYDLTPAMVEGAIRNKLIEMGWTPPQKPKQKIIDLSKVWSDIDCEFGGNKSLWLISKYENRTEKGYMSALGPYRYCRIRQDHPHANIWLKCPLPEGLKVSVYYNDGGVSGIITNYLDIDWHNVKRFYVYGTADTHRYEWQKEKEE